MEVTQTLQKYWLSDVEKTMTFFLFFLHLGSYIIVARANFSVCYMYATRDQLLKQPSNMFFLILSRFSWTFLSFWCFTGSGFYSPIIFYFFNALMIFFFWWIVFIPCPSCFGETFYDLDFWRHLKILLLFIIIMIIFKHVKAIFVGSLIMSLWFSRELESGKLN